MNARQPVVTIAADTMLEDAAAAYTAGDWQKAGRLCRQILDWSREHPAALELLGIIAAQTGRAAEAIELLQRAVSAAPDNAQAHFNYANLLHASGSFESALVNYARAVAIEPEFAEAYFNQGNTLLALQRFADALESYQRALSIRPRFTEALINRAVAWRGMGRLGDALQSCEGALQLDAGSVAALLTQATLLVDLRRTDAALASCERALALRSDSAEAHNTRGVVLQDLGRLDDALESFRAALALRPDYADAHRNRGGVLQALGRYAEAAESLERALQIAPDYPWLLGTLTFNQLQVCNWTALPARLEELGGKVREGARVTQPFAALALLDSPDLQRRAAASWVTAAGPTEAEPLAARAPRGDGVIRLGYFSADYHDHATTYLAAGLLEAHDRRRFRIVGFSFGPPAHDHMRRRVAMACDEFLEVNGLGDREVAALSRARGIDIAIDLKGFTQNSRPGIFAARAAPVQVSYLGYPGTMAAPYMDYLVADNVLIPQDSRAHYAEQLVYLPHSYQVNDRKRLIAARQFSRRELSLPEDAFVFCCFNNCWKITPGVFDGWMRILRAVPRSVLWLLDSSPTATRNLCREALARGVGESRLVFAPHLPVAEHLARQRAADLCLDTLPYNAHTTASDALWAGVPILTRAGQSFAARVTASLLGALGLDELITHSAEDYETLAVSLASDPQRLEQLRAKLHAQRLVAPLFDTGLFTAHLEAAYGEMQRRCRAGLAPEDIDVRTLSAGS
ncbi:MAG: tetratricopeptide repeat protein [Gammaproteobacteria bacterium]|nr:tetratricopeptide repeat protein [Gammaproteobacteria bacterium]